MPLVEFWHLKLHVHLKIKVFLFFFFCFFFHIYTLLAACSHALYICSFLVLSLPTVTQKKKVLTTSFAVTFNSLWICQFTYFKGFDKSRKTFLIKGLISRNVEQDVMKKL